MLGGYWLRAQIMETKTAKNPMPMAGNAFIGFDAEQKKLVMGWIDNMGGYSTGSSDGWNGDTIVFAGPMHGGGMTMTGRDTFTKMGDKKMSHVFDVEMNGAWNKALDETCSK
jgi:hypothetical protein